MFEIFRTYLKESAGLNEVEIQQIISVTVAKKLRKRHYLLEDGKICIYQSFVVKGCLRHYTMGTDGTEHILNFALENQWISDHESYIYGTPARGNIDAVSECELIVIHRENWDALILGIPKFRDLRDKLLIKSFHEAEDRIMRHMSQSLDERYKAFLMLYPGILECVPRHMAASYLGVSRETLSRIRS